MAKPRIFLSSTFYDLRHVRDDLDRFIKDLGYEPVRHEVGSIPYGKDDAPEKYAYREVGLCDIIVCVIGGRFGTESRDGDGYSITQNEIRRALDLGIQVFIFVERGVLGEFSTYQVNKENTDVNYKFVDDVRVYKFIETLFKLPNNNPIAPFESTRDITDFLKLQWAGLFQRFLQEQQRLSEIKRIEEIKAVSNTLRDLVSFLTKERQEKDEAINSILFSNHPAFSRFASITNILYRVFFTTSNELSKWLSAIGFTSVDPLEYDSDSHYEWGREDGYIKVVEEIFDKDERLKPYSIEEWDDNWVLFVVPPAVAPPTQEDDIPF